MQIDEDIKAFLIEGYEHLEQIESDLVALERDRSDPEIIDRIYRDLHTIKGNSGFLGLENLGAVAHAGENLLSRLRDRTLTMNSAIATTLLDAIDVVRQHFQSLEITGNESADPSTNLLARLWEIGNGEIDSETPFSPPVPDFQLPPLDLNEATPTSITDSAIRVDVGLLDKLMNLVGELVLCRNQILEFANTQVAQELKDNTFKSVSGRLNQVTSELQEGVMKTRMQPIRTVWSKFPRVVRDIAESLGKQVRLKMEGEETELDKMLLEAIANPLTHLIRNSLDHGLETPEVRRDRGKSAIGTLILRAYHESGHAIVEISDDGGGIDPERVKQKAVQRGAISPDRAAQMTDRQALELIFLPGFSTAEQITSLSGRGVGMDVVRANIEKINGTIDVQSRVDRGTTFKLKIPLTLAIIPTLMITTGGDRYAIPQVNLVELVRLEGEQTQSIEMFYGTPVYRLRGKLLPLVYLNQELGVEASDRVDPDVLNIVVVQSTEKPFGLVVDAINDTQEIVVKPLGKQIRSISFFAGATIMGDGQVALILDVQGIAQKTHLLSEAEEKAILAEEGITPVSSAEPEQLLLFNAAENRRMAIPLMQVSRLEEIPCHLLERVGDRYAIQYRQQIVPLIDLSSIFSGDRDLTTSGEETLSVVVVSQQNGQVGFVVDRILDVVEQSIEIKGASLQEEILCCAVVQDRITEVLDVDATLAKNLYQHSGVR